MDEAKPKGGKREGAGRKTKAEELKANAIFSNAISKLYGMDEEEAKYNFITKELLGTQRGNLFIAEHLFGKPKETIDSNVNLNNFSIKDVLTFKKE